MKRTISILLLALVFAACKKDDAILKPNDLSTTENFKKPTMAAFDRSKTKTPAPVPTLSFSGYSWTITDFGTTTHGPGPNYWSSANCYVDASGYLHMELTKNTKTKVWECSQVVLNQSLGYGTYQWEVEGRIDAMDKNVVFAMFNYSGNDGYDEMDIEYSKWGGATKTNLDYHVYPATGSTLADVEYNATVTLTSTYSTHRLVRYSNELIFQSLAGFQDSGNTGLLATKTWYNPPAPISTLPMPAYMNLWLYQGKAPSNGKNVEIIIHSFKFTPLATS